MVNDTSTKGANVPFLIVISVTEEKVSWPADMRMAICFTDKFTSTLYTDTVGVLDDVNARQKEHFTF